MPTALSKDSTTRHGCRVAILVKQPAEAFDITDASDPTCGFLLASGRWCEVVVPVNDGNKHIVISSLYGHSGASGEKANRSSGSLYQLNEELIKRALARAKACGLPYYLCTDLNIDPRESDAINTARTKG